MIFLSTFAPLISTLEHYKGLFDCLKRCDLLPRFFIHGSMTFVRKAIIEVNLDSYRDHFHWRYIRSAVILSLNEGRHDRFIGLLEAIQETGPSWFNSFMHQFFRNFVPEKNSIPLMRFLAMRGEELGEKYPRLLKTFCLTLVHYLKLWPSYPSRRALLLDLIGQPSLITPIIFTEAFFRNGNPYPNNQLDFIIYGCRETMAEGLKEAYPKGGRDLWRVLTKTFPDQFSGEYPYSDEARNAVLARFKTKQQMEDECGVEISSKVLGLLKKLIPDLPMIPLNSIAKYLVPWITLTQIPSQRHLVLQTREQVSERLTTLIERERYWEVARVCNSMSDEEFLEHLCQVMSTLKHFDGLVWYLTYRDALPSFLEHGKMALVREVIAALTSYKYGYCMYPGDIKSAVIQSFNENRHDHAIDLLKAVQERYADEDEQRRQIGKMPEFNYFMGSFMKLFAPEKNNVSDKLFLFMHREEFNSDYRSVFEVFCLSLVKT